MLPSTESRNPYESGREPWELHTRFRDHFAARTRTVLDVPFDPALVDGDSIVYDALSPATR